VDVELHHIFSCERARGSEWDHYSLVNNRSGMLEGVVEFAMVDSPRFVVMRLICELISVK